MYKGQPFANKVLQRMEVEKLMETHQHNLKNVRPNTDFQETRDKFFTLNPKKKQMQREAKFTEIQRENRLLLEKINGIMNKKRCNSQNQMKSLNVSLRKKQSQTIQVQNAKMLRRLQDRKSDYSVGKYRKQWSKTKKMIKNITSYPIVIQNISKARKKNNNSIDFQQLKLMAYTAPQQFELVKHRTISNRRFIITLRFSPNKLVIIGDCRIQKQLKVIEIDKEDAISMIRENCQGDINKIFQYLRFDQNQKSLFLLLNSQNQNAEQQVAKVQQKVKPSYRQLKNIKPIIADDQFSNYSKEHFDF